MKRIYQNSENGSTATRTTKNEYTTDFATFNQAAVKQSTGQATISGGYNLFVSDKGELVGSYSVTAKQDSYRALNASINSKVTRR